METKTDSYSSSAVEALILASPEPLATGKIIQAVHAMTPRKVGEAVTELNNRYMSSGSSFRIREVAGGYQFYIMPEFVSYVEELFSRRRKLRLTRASLETASIIAYKQPVTKAEIEHIRGVASDGVINNLLDKKMVAISGRAKTVGRPLQYGTTDEFLKFFGLNDLSDLPTMSEIEELIAAAEATNQTELSLPADADKEKSEKLNVADGTFDPAARLEDEIGEKSSRSEATPGDVETSGERRALILTGQSEPAAVEGTTAEEETEKEADPSGEVDTIDEDGELTSTTTVDERAEHAANTHK